MRLLLFSLLLLLLGISLQAQTDTTISSASGKGEVVFISEIEIDGNKKTDVKIIERELLVAEGDTIGLEALGELLERSEELIMNTGLFNRASISFKEWEGSTNRVALLVFVEEAWYLYPVPVFELADRNFNVWWVEQERSLKRTNVGMDFAHINVTGRKDKLKFSVKYGYTRRYSAYYEMPYINRRQTLGVSAEVALFQNREINYKTEGNKQLFYRDEDQFVYQRFRALGGLIYRPGINNTHLFQLGYRQNQLDAAVATDLNPEFLLDGRTLQRYFSLSYRFLHDLRDVSAYPWRGHFFSAIVSKDGLGIFDDRNGLETILEYQRYFPIGRRWSLATQAKTKLSLIRSRQPYNDNRAMGFGQNYPHGYEYYVIDGLDMGLLKTSMRFRFWESGIDFKRLMPVEALQFMPFHCNLSLNSDFGYVNSPYTRAFNPLNNRLIWGGGIGLDIVLYYNKVIQIEYSINDLMENGVFLHLNMNI
jgi:outer membrane protein assembly factor BamA